MHAHAHASPFGSPPLADLAADVLGRSMRELTHHSHAVGAAYADTDCPIFNAFRRALPCRIDTEVFWRRDGTAFPVECSNYPIVDGDAVRGAVITFVDITERTTTSSISWWRVPMPREPA